MFLTKEKPWLSKDSTELSVKWYKNTWQKINKYLAKYFTKGIIGVKYKLGLGFDEAEELHKPIRHKFKRRRVFMFNIDDIWSADLKDMQSLAKENDGYKYLLNVIDLFSKTAYSIH